METFGRLCIAFVFCGWMEISLGQKYDPRTRIDDSSQQPVTGNLLIGRADKLSASSTCGMEGPQRFCIVSHLVETKKCFKCDSRGGYLYETHRIENVIYEKHQRSSLDSWWQSENGKENVTIQLDLETEFYFTHLIMRFKTFRPQALVVERSSDYGLTWKPYRYFADNCAKAFPQIMSQRNYKELSDIYCEESYSKPTPVTDGEVILRLIHPQMQKQYDHYSTMLQNLMKLTNLRINFIKLHTLGDDLLDKRQEIQEKYYYAISKMAVHGFCWCHGHANKCLPISDSENDVPGMIHGRCDCGHNTAGRNCSRCLDTHNDLPWKPAIGQVKNSCQKCNCNDHAETCDFNEEVYQQSGHISGSVCKNCADNTAGKNCEQCLPKFYHDVALPITDKYTCLPCECNDEGTVDGGLCDKPVDEYDDRKCHCKDNVEGSSCSVCKPGFWNLDSSNPQGCEACTCDLRGTIGSTCNRETGSCKCKENVEGKDCNQCYPTYWGLSNETAGCKPCECDEGGSYGPDCDVITGQCRCKPHVAGRTCNTLEENYYVRTPALVYEAEDASCLSYNCPVEVKEWPREGKPHWTGLGYRRVQDGSDLEFIIDNIPQSMEYDLIIRHDNVKSHEEIDVVATLERLNDPGSICSESQRNDESKFFLQSRELYSEAASLCLEEGHPYKLKLSFSSSSNSVQFNHGQTTSILIDSIVLVPNPNSLSNFKKMTEANRRLIENYERLRCKEKFNKPTESDYEECKKYYFSISIIIYNEPYKCNCNGTGSTSLTCDQIGGKCLCKNKVIGRTCDRCAEGTFDFFSSDGCKDCNCNSIGALDNFCDSASGKCKCVDNIDGRACDQCPSGLWDFPNCKPCSCNNHAVTCNSSTGECYGCSGFTTGFHCDECSAGYYGEPAFGDICKPCRCPDTVDSGHSFASTCIKSDYDTEVVCICKEGYKGPRCDQCADNYFGHPEEIGGSCQPCDCSGNIDLSQPGNCNPHTGECIQCLHSTTGRNCEKCLPNHFGNPLQQDCQNCDCDLLGTNKSLGFCNPETGQCPCLPNIEGRKCDKCAPNFWLIARNNGCIPCDCDDVGSNSTLCNEFIGQCSCNTGFGGRRCNECQTNFWGEPTVKCYPCNCSGSGAVWGVCNQKNGSCICKTGVTGDKCDMCTRGYHGSVPYCESCDECFTNWNQTIHALSKDTDIVITEAKEIGQTGTPGQNTGEFDNLSNKLEEVNKTLANVTANALKLEELQKDIDNFRLSFNDSFDTVHQLSNKVSTVVSNVTFANHMLGIIQNSTKELSKNTEELKNNATKLQEEYLKGALNVTRQAGKTANSVIMLEKKIETTYLHNAERECKRVEFFLSNEKEEANSNDKTWVQVREQNNEARRNNLEHEFHVLESAIPDMNALVCARKTSTCDATCGGAGCGKCGGSVSCEGGAVGKAAAGLDLAQRFKTMISGNLTNADGLYRNISNARQQVRAAHEAAKNVHMMAGDLKTRFEAKVTEVVTLHDEIQSFLNESGATPTEISALVEKVLNLELHLEPQQIKKLALEINQTIASLADVNKIVEETKEHQEKALDLKMKSDKAEEKAKQIETEAQSIIKMLQGTETAQSEAEKNLSLANQDMIKTKKVLDQIISETEAGQTKLHELKDEVNSTRAQLKNLQTQEFMNKHNMQQIQEEAKDVTKKIQMALDDVPKLKDDYKTISDNITSRLPITSNSTKSRAEKLLKRAQDLSLKTKSRLTNLLKAETDYNMDSQKLKEIEQNITKLNSEMNSYIIKINAKAALYNNCPN